MYDIILQELMKKLSSPTTTADITVLVDTVKEQTTAPSVLFQTFLNRFNLYKAKLDESLNDFTEDELTADVKDELFLKFKNYRKDLKKWYDYQPENEIDY